MIRAKQDINYKIYLDVCCLNRPFDDWTQERIRLEGEAILSIMERIRAKKWQLVTSEAITVELGKMRNLEKLVPCGVNTHTIFKPSQQSIFRSF